MPQTRIRSFKKDLDIEVESVTGEYTMRYIVTDKETRSFYSVETDRRLSIPIPRD